MADSGGCPASGPSQRQVRAARRLMKQSPGCGEEAGPTGALASTLPRWGGQAGRADIRMLPLPRRTWPPTEGLPASWHRSAGRPEAAGHSPRRQRLLHGTALKLPRNRGGPQRAACRPQSRGARFPSALSGLHGWREHRHLQALAPRKEAVHVQGHRHCRQPIDARRSSLRVMRLARPRGTSVSHGSRPVLCQPAVPAWSYLRTVILLVPNHEDASDMSLRDLTRVEGRDQVDSEIVRRSAPATPRSGGG